MKLNSKVLGISGKLGSGKDTVAEMIIRHSPEVWKQTAFAKKLKQIVSILAQVPYETTLNQAGKNHMVDEFDLTVGEMLQQIGTNVLRGWNENVWIKSLLLELKSEVGTNWLITDARFPNEADFLKNNGSFIIRVNRPVNPVAEASGRDLNHPSETALDDYAHFDYVIENDGTLEDLEVKVINMLSVLYSAEVPQI